MNRSLHHRGPDDEGIWMDPTAGVYLAHRRLAVLDLSQHGHQPMVSANGRWVLAYNGEIYNFQALRKELDADPAFHPGASWIGHSDTEVILESIAYWGLESALSRFVGMFAFALWDNQERVLTLVRDRMGEKPLYYGWQGKSFLFGSELKAFQPHPEWRGEIDRNSLALYMRHNYIPTPYSIYKGIHKLTPGTILQIPAKASPGAIPDPKAYWQVKEAANQGTAQPLILKDSDAVEALDELLRETIRDKMISDVSLGAFLSGGIDSSTIVALMQVESNQPVKTFSIGFHEEEFNEARHALAVANHLGTEHTELYVTADQARGVIPKLPLLYDEPFSDSSQIPTYLVSEMTKQHVTVALSGDGGDELFGGYNRYIWGRSIWNKIGHLPKAVRHAAAWAITALSPQQWDKLFSGIGPVLPNTFRQPLPGDKLHKLAAVLNVNSVEEMYRNLVSHWNPPDEIVLGAQEPATALTDPNRWANLKNLVQHMQFLDGISYLPDDILVKVDRAAMGVSLETRVPFLDHRVVDFAWRVPLSMKVRNGQGKWILRQVLNRYVPETLIDRPKMGFGVPIDQWLRGPLRDWANELLNEKRLRQEGFLNGKRVQEKWQEHLSGRRNWQYLLWDVLMFQAWHEHWVKS